MRRWPRPLVVAVDMVNRRGKAVGVRLVRYTGKSTHLIHPKHLVAAPWHDWYVERLRPGDVVLDVGCANGAHTVKAAAPPRRVVGIDYDVGQLRVARATARSLGVGNVLLFAWDLTRPLPFEAGTFDTPWACLIDAVGGLSLGLYQRLARWKRGVALRRPAESTGFRLVARRSL